MRTKDRRPKQRFTIFEFSNPRTGSISWRVSGIKRDGERIRENFANSEDAQKRQIALEGEFHQRPDDMALRATRLSEHQVKLAEAGFRLLDRDEDLLMAIQAWITGGRKQSIPTEAPKLDEAHEAFKKWLEATPSLRPITKRSLGSRVGMFINSIGNLRVNLVTPEIIEAFLDGRKDTDKVSANTAHADKRSLHRFFAWCVERPRRWLTSNPCALVKVERGEAGVPEILPLKSTMRLIVATKRYRDGALMPFLAACLFGGMRPYEVARLTWDQVNLDDREIRIEGAQSKTKRSRTVKLDEPLIAWLKWSEARGHKSFAPVNWRKGFAAIKRTAKLGTWTPDVLRHTAISHYFRKCGSYGLTAEWAGNSEAIIKAHYQGRVTSEDSAKFWMLFPDRERRRMRPENVVQMPQPAKRLLRKAVKSGK